MTYRDLLFQLPRCRSLIKKVPAGCSIRQAERMGLITGDEAILLLAGVVFLASSKPKQRRRNLTSGRVVIRA